MKKLYETYVLCKKVVKKEINLDLGWELIQKAFILSIVIFYAVLCHHVIQMLSFLNILCLLRI